MRGQPKNKFNVKIIITLGIIVLLGVVLRFYALGAVPVGFHRDEAYFGYNAYSVLKTGKDITGNFLPIHIESFLHSPAGYMYFAVPWVALFGLQEFAVRISSALFGSATIILLYFLVRQLFLNYRYNQMLALVSCLLLAISPWHINLSRVATENVLVVFFVLLGTLLYLYWIQTQKVWLLLVSMICFAETLFLYQAPRAFLPFFLPLLFLVYRPKFLKKNWIYPAVCYLVLIITPILLILSSPNLTERIRMLSIFQHEETQLVLDEQIREDGSTGTRSVYVTRLFHNKVINFSETFLTNYFSHLSYEFLFTDKGLPDRYRVPNMGLLYLFELPLLLIGAVMLYINERKKAFLLFGWILLAPVGSAFTFDDIPNLQRTLHMYPALAIIGAYGLVTLWFKLSGVKFGIFAKLIVIAVMSYSLLYYLHQYYVHQILHRPWFRQEGYEKLVADVLKLEGNYKKIIITDEESDPAIFFLFYSNYDPQTLQTSLEKLSNKDFRKAALPKYDFVKHDCPLREVDVLNQNTKAMEVKLLGEKNNLYVNSGNCRIHNEHMRKISEIRRSDDSVVFTLNEVN